MDALADLKARFAELAQAYQADPALCWLPVRHHSPACAAHTLAQLHSHRPQVVLIEAPGAFLRHLPVLQDPEATPPLAIYQDEAYYPFAENSPEWQALRWAGQNGAEVRFIDLDHKPQQSQEGWNDARFLSSDYSRRLQQHLGCRDADELWQRLFEQVQFASAGSFFLQVLLFCAASRACYSPQSLADEGDLARETQMRAHIKAARGQYQRLAVLTGGFHTPALFAWADENAALQQGDPADSFVIRYTDKLLEARNGYGAGMPYPAFCRWQFQQRHLDADSWLLFLLDQMPALPLVYKQNCFEHLQQLCRLRGLARPGSYDLLDSLGSCLIKEQLGAKTLAPWQQVLSGQAMGQLPAHCPSPPLVEEVRAACRAARLHLDQAGQCHFDLYDMTAGARERRQLLARLLFLETGFTQPQQGYQVLTRLDVKRRHESWRYHWTPTLEVALARQSAKGSKLATLVSQALDSRQLDSLDHLVSKQLLAVQLGLPEHLDKAQLAEQLAHCSDIKALAASFITLVQAANHPLFAAYDLVPLYRSLWQQLGYQLPALNQLEDQEALALLLSLQGVALMHEADLKDQWRDRLQWLIQHSSHKPTLDIALRALALDLDGADPAPLLHQLKLQDDPFPLLEALLKVVPHWLHQQQGLLALLNQWLAGQSPDQFLERLPAMRALFCHLDAREVDRVCQQLQQLNQWQGGINWLRQDLNEQDHSQGLALEATLRQRLTAQGLEQWLSN